MHLYFHIPFCHKICPYCAFHKHTLAGHHVAKFVEALTAEIAWVGREYGQQGQLQNVRTIHFGGGTPSLLKAEYMERIFEALDKVCPLNELEEIALEANPSTFDLNKAKAWKALGINRVSLGVQSFDPTCLQLLGRDHSAQEAVEAARWVKQAGIEQLNIDLMFSLPKQSLEQWQADLHQALALEPEHISAYNLTWEEDTEFLQRLQRGEFEQSAQRDAACFELTGQLLGEAGFEHYEVSNFAKAGNRSLHNQAYWQGKDYLGLGPGAVSTWQRKRWKNIANTPLWQENWLKEKPALRVEEETLSEENWRIERIALGLRQAQGIHRDWLLEKTSSTVEMLINADLVEQTEEKLRLTPKGFGLADEICLQLI